MLACCCALAACGKGGSVASKPETDPAFTSALADPLMVDPDLSSQNRAAAAFAIGGPPVAELPLVERTPQAIEDAKDEARRIAGGELKPAPAPQSGGATPSGVTIAQIAATSGVAEACAGKAEYGMVWSLSLPAPLAIYPKAHLQEAAGTDRDGCRMRALSFVTPVEAGDVVDFYFTRLTGARLAARHSMAGDVHLLQGGKGGLGYALQVRKLEDGLTRVDLVSNGG